MSWLISLSVENVVKMLNNINVASNLSIFNMKSVSLSEELIAYLIIYHDQERSSLPPACQLTSGQPSHPGTFWSKLIRKNWPYMGNSVMKSKHFICLILILQR